MDEREWKFPKLSEQAQHYILSQLLLSLGHYLFIGSMNEVDLSESSTSLFVKSALEDFPCIPMNYCCANQSLNKFSSTDSRVQGTLGFLFARELCPVSQYHRVEGALGSSRLCKTLLDGTGKHDYSPWGIEEQLALCPRGCFVRFLFVLDGGLSTATGWEVLPECFSSLCTISCPHGRQFCPWVRNQ